MRVVTVVGARPQFIKAAPVCFALRDAGIEELLVHTGQHYDEKMSDVFFSEMGIPNPAFNLGIGSGSHGRQTSEMLVRIEEVLIGEKPDTVIVYGDTNSTLAAALASSKLNIPIAHVEAGLRSYNKTMPEEHNRVLTDHCSTLLFCPTQTAVDNLAGEGLSGGVHLVGDTMYDAVLAFLPKAESCSTILDRVGVAQKSFYLVTIHRPYNTDDPRAMAAILAALAQLNSTVVFPVHPRTVARLALFGLQLPGNVRVIDPVGYLDMLVLERNARVVLTDSGGVQKEACFLSTPCVTLRPETEWVETVETGWNVLAWNDSVAIIDAFKKQLSPPAQPCNAYGDGYSARKIAAIIAGQVV